MNIRKAVFALFAVVCVLSTTKPSFTVASCPASPTSGAGAIIDENTCLMTPPPAPRAMQVTPKTSAMTPGTPYTPMTRALRAVDNLSGISPERFGSPEMKQLDRALETFKEHPWQTPETRRSKGVKRVFKLVTGQEPELPLTAQQLSDVLFSRADCEGAKKKRTVARKLSPALPEDEEMDQLPYGDQLPSQPLLVVDKKHIAGECVDGKSSGGHLFTDGSPDLDELVLGDGNVLHAKFKHPSADTPKHTTVHPQNFTDETFDSTLERTAKQINRDHKLGEIFFPTHETPVPNHSYSGPSLIAASANKVLALIKPTDNAIPPYVAEMFLSNEERDKEGTLSTPTQATSDELDTTFLPVKTVFPVSLKLADTTDAETIRSMLSETRDLHHSIKYVVPRKQSIICDIAPYLYAKGLINIPSGMLRAIPASELDIECIKNKFPFLTPLAKGESCKDSPFAVKLQKSTPKPNADPLYALRDLFREPKPQNKRVADLKPVELFASKAFGDSSDAPVSALENPDDDQSMGSLFGGFDW